MERTLSTHPKQEIVAGVAQEALERHIAALPLYDALELTKGGDLAKIRLSDQIYTLRVTRAGKLILTK